MGNDFFLKNYKILQGKSACREVYALQNGDIHFHYYWTFKKREQGFRPRTNEYKSRIVDAEDFYFSPLRYLRI